MYNYLANFTYKNTFNNFSFSPAALFSSFYESTAYVFLKIKKGTIGDLYELYKYEDKFIVNELVDRAKDTNIGIAYAGPSWYWGTPKIVVVMGNQENIQKVADYGESIQDPDARAPFDIVDKLAGNKTIIRLQGEEAQRQKKIISSFLHGNTAIQNSWEKAEKRFNHLMQNWDTDKSYQTYFSYFAANVIGECVMSIPEFELEDIPFIRYLSDFIIQPKPDVQEINAAKEKIAALSYKLLQKYGEVILSSKNFVSCLNGTNGQEITNANINEIYEKNKVAILYIVENNLSNALMMALIQIHQAPEIKERLIEELIRNNCHKNFDLNILKTDDFPYLDAVVKETLRFLSPAGLIARQTSKATTLNITDPAGKEKMYHLPAHSRMFVPLNYIHHAPFWENADEFKPERFLPENLPENYRKNYMPFSTGKRSCPAALHFVPTVMKKVIVMSLFYELKFSHALDEIKIPSTSIAPHWEKDLFLTAKPCKITDDLFLLSKRRLEMNCK